MWRVLVQPQVTTILVIIVNVGSNKSEQMAATKHNHERKEFPAATADPAFRYPVLPGTAIRDATRLDTHRPDRVHDKRIEDRVTVENEILWRGIVGKCFPQLLDNPRRGRVARGVEVYNMSPAILDYEPYVEHFERDRRHGEEIHRRNGVFVVA